MNNTEHLEISPQTLLISSFITPKIILIIWFGLLRVMIQFLYHVTHL